VKVADKKIRVLIADDLQPMLKGFQDILQFAADIEIVGMAASPEETVRMAGDLKPDVLMLDMVMDRYDLSKGAKVIRRVRDMSPQTRILVHTAYDNLIEEARRAGAHKAVSKIDINSLEEIQRAVHDTYDCFTPPIPEEMLEGLSQLTPREKEVLALITKGYDTKKIAEELVISRPTVKGHTTSIFGKLGVKNRNEAAALDHKYHLADL
jgi:NarL family two-component system response regulator LiaR